MQLTLDRVKSVDIPLNVSKYPNNAHLAYNQSAIYNDSVNLYKSIKLVIEDLVNLTPSATNINVVQNSNSALIESSDGLDGVLTAVTDTLAGLMLPQDKIILDDLAVLVGITGDNLGTFTGSIISDNSTIKQALQQLETAVETSLVGATNLSVTYGTNDVTIVSSTGADAVILGSSPLSAGIVTSSEHNIIWSVPAIQALTGIPALQSDLGTFTGSIITNNVDIKTALQELEDAIEVISVGGGIYGGSGNIFPGAIATTSSALGFTIDNNGTDNIYFGDITGAGQGIVLGIEPNFIKMGNLYDNADRIIYCDVSGSGLRFVNSHVIASGTGVEIQAINNMVITGGVGFQGARYFADYSANYTARSLVDKEYVDGLTGTTTNLSSTLSNTQVEIFSSSGTSTIIPSATTSFAGLMSAQDKINLTDLITLSGMPAGADHLGTFTGTTIPDNQSIKSALQSLETAVENASLSAGGYQLVTTNWTLEPVNNTIYARAISNNINITCGSGMKEGEIYYLYTRTDNGYAVNLILGAGHQFFKTSLVSGVEFWTGSQSYSGDDRNMAIMLQRRGTVVFLTTLTDF